MESSPKAQCTVDFIHIGLFFCLRSCEYTKTHFHRRTTQFRFQDIQFHNAAGVIPADDCDKIFLEAWATTLFLYTKKTVCTGNQPQWKQPVCNTATLSAPQPAASSTYIPTAPPQTPLFTRIIHPMAPSPLQFQAGTSQALFVLPHKN